MSSLCICSHNLPPLPIVCRGDDFRVEFFLLGEVRSLIPQKVNIMALTATATRTLRSDVCHVLRMKDPHIVTVSPDKSNVILRAGFHPEEIILGGKLQEMGVALYTFLYNCPKFWGGSFPPHPPPPPPSG